MYDARQSNPIKMNKLLIDLFIKTMERINNKTERTATAKTMTTFICNLNLYFCIAFIYVKRAKT